MIEPDGKGGSIYKKTLLFWGVVQEETAEMYTQGSQALSNFLKEHLEEGKRYEPEAAERALD